MTETQPEFKLIVNVAQLNDVINATGRISDTAFYGFARHMASKLAAKIRETANVGALELMVSGALFPEQLPWYHVQLQSESLETPINIAAIKEVAEDLPAPSVIEGPVGFAVHLWTEGAPITMTPMGAVWNPEKLAEFDGIAYRKSEYPRPHVDVVPFWQRWLNRMIPQRTQVDPKEEYRQRCERFWRRLNLVQGSADDRAMIASKPHYKPVLMAESAKLMESQEKYSEARTYYRKAIELQSDFGLYHAMIAGTYMAEDNMSGALEAFTKSIDLSPWDCEVFEARGQLYGSLGANEKAFSDFETAISLAPRNPSGYVLRSAAHTHLDRLSEAIEDLETAIRLAPNVADYQTRYASLLSQTETPNWQKIADIHSRALDIEPGTVETLLARAWAFAQQSKTGLAMEDCMTAIEIDPSHGGAYGLYGNLLQQENRIEEAIDACSRAIELEPEFPFALIARGNCYAVEGQFELALSDCEAALELSPEDPFALKLKAMLAMQQGEMESALETLDQAAKLHPEWTTPEELKAMAHRFNDNPEVAIEKYNGLIEQEPDQVGHYMNRGLAFNESKQFSEAEKDLTQATEMAPELGTTWRLRAEYYRQRQEFEKALHRPESLH